MTTVRAQSAAGARSLLGKLIPVLLVIGLGAVVLYKAWVSDDFYITFRTIENVVQGRGLVAIASGIGFTAAASLMLAFGVAATPLTACAGLALLTALRAFTHFSTSGLENPLLHVLLAGLAPLVAWEGFSLVYYGSLLPNSAVAKLTSGIPSAELARQGLYYLRISLANDPITLIVVALA
ncbi:MAG: hypothetical protein ABL971_12605 [Vicinamibacterales bacterium]